MSKLLKSGEPFVWLTGGALAVGLVMVIGLVVLILIGGLGFFWPKPIERLTLDDDRVVMGQITERERMSASDAAASNANEPYRIKVKQGNRPANAADFVWIDEPTIAAREKPADAAIIERREWGNMVGVVTAVKAAGELVASGADAAWPALESRLPPAQATVSAIRRIERNDIGRVNLAQERIRLKLRRLQLAGMKSGPDVDRLATEMAALGAKYAAHTARIESLRASLTSVAVVTLSDGNEQDLPLAQIVRAYRPNRMGVFGKCGFYAAKLWEFVSDDPRESNTEGGVFPAIFGTVMMVLIMSVLVTPLGVLAALYLREYAKQGPLVSAVRIAVNNLAGVPSIVFGVFGVGFFIYFLGGSIDRVFFPESLPTPTYGTGGILWASLTLALMTVPVVIVATEEGIAAIPRGMRDASLALGATKWETTRRVVLPAVLPSILTGLILAMARAAGEVAPLMITGVVKLAPSLPLDGVAPFFHPERKFMHLGFHIYDVGFQSPNADAARPMVFATTLLLLVIVILLNLTAITLRNRLRRKFAGSAV